MTQVLVASPVLPVTRDLQDYQDHQANQELQVLVQVVVAPQVFQEPWARRERKVTRAYQAMALKDSPALLGSPDPPALLDLRALQVLPQVYPLLYLDSLGHLDPEERRVTQDTKASEVILVTVPALVEASQGCQGYLDPQETTVSPAFRDERASLVTLVRPALMAFRDLLAVLVTGVSLVVRERKGRLTTPARVWA